MVDAQMIELKKRRWRAVADGEPDKVDVEAAGEFITRRRPFWWCCPHRCAKEALA